MSVKGSLKFNAGPFRTEIPKNKKGSVEMYGFKAFVFDGKKTARKAFDTLDDYTPAYVWVGDIAEVSRNKHGSIRVHSTWAQDDSEVGAGAGFGAVTGGMLGLVFGPGGALAGAALGGSLGAMFGAADEIAFDDPALDDFAASLATDTSALVLVGEEATLADYVSAVEPFGGKLVETNLNEDDVKALKKALKKND
jgi:uncharacterized membrane protein